MVVVQVLGLFLGAALIFRLEIRRKVIWVVSVGLLSLFFAYLFLSFPDELFEFDYRIFWHVGNDVWSGLNPYAADRFGAHPFLNPPTAFPLFAAFAVFSLDFSRALWGIANALALCGLAVFAQCSLLAQERGEKTPGSEMAAWALSPSLLAGLTGTLAVSTAGFAGFATGQLGLLVTFALLAALQAQACGQPRRAGLWLALASIKPATLLPFLLLFGRRSDRPTWLTFTAGVVALTLMATPAAQCLERVQQMLSHVQELQAPGQVNDFSFEGTQHTTMLGLDHALYRLGIRDRAAAQAGQYLLVGCLGCILSYLILARPSIPRPAACALIAAFSCIFLYHRVYDTVILMLPLVYCVGQARSRRGAIYVVFASAALAILLIWYLPIQALWALANLSLESGGGRALEALLLPYATWLILFLMAAIVVGGRLIMRSGGLPKHLC
jgi:hypothetical protein